MFKGSYASGALIKKYERFSPPGCEVLIGTVKLMSDMGAISELSVEITAGGGIGGCAFTLSGMYDVKNSKWNANVTKALKPGAPLKISMGYVKREPVFYGYIDEVTYEFGDERGPLIRVSGLDGLGYLMNMRAPVVIGEKPVKDVIKTMLNESVSAGCAKKVTVGAAVSDFKVKRIKDNISNYQFLSAVAGQLGMSLFAVNGELIFDKVVTVTKPLMSLTLGNVLLNFSKRLSLSKQVGKVIVRGRDANNERIKGEASSTTLPGSGSAAAKTASKLLSKMVLEEESGVVMTAADCKKLAQNRFNALAMEYVFGEGSCMGLPELIPGRYITVKGMDAGMNGDYFLQKVVHTYGEEGYRTAFEVRGAKSK